MRQKEEIMKKVLESDRTEGAKSWLVTVKTSNWWLVKNSYNSNKYLL